LLVACVEGPTGWPKLWFRWLTCEWFRCVVGDATLWKELWVCDCSCWARASSLTAFVFSRCHINTLWTIAQPQNIMPRPINTLVTIAGVEWNCIKVYSMIPVKNTGIEMKNPPTAQTRLTEDFWRYLLVLQ
jgi:hypothetical protein